MLPYADIVFGNESECLAFGEHNGFAGQSIDAIAVQLAALPKKNAQRTRLL